MIDRKDRPVFLNLARIRLPVTALVSLGHRASGLVLFLALGPALYLLDRALESPQGYAEAAAWLATDVGRLALVLLAWSLAHHVAAGLRVLLLDLHLGVFLPHARYSAAAAAGFGMLVLFVSAVLLW
jgi:succinate dehydrogenase / fumarate reductase cytochrome b subunit